MLSETLISDAMTALIACEDVQAFKRILHETVTAAGQLEGEQLALFLDQPLSRWAQFMLTQVAYRWLPLFDHSERASLFDTFFLMDTVPRPLAVFMACRALATDKPQLASPDASKIATASEVARLLLLLLRPSELPRLFQGLESQGAPNPAALLDELLKTPARLNNVLQIKSPALFQREVFLSVIATGLVREVSRGGSTIVQCQLLHHRLVSTLKGQHRRLKSLTNAWLSFHGDRLMVDALLVPENSTGEFVEAFVLSFDQSIDADEPWFRMALEPALKHTHSARRAVIERLFLGHVLKDDTIRSLTKLFHSMKFLGAALSEIASTWAQANFVQRTEATLQDSVCRVIVFALRLFPREDLHGGSGQVMVSLIHGVSLRLHSSVPSIRKGAIRVAEAFGDAIGQPLVFDEEEAAATAAADASPNSNEVVMEAPKTVALPKLPKLSKAPPDPDAPVGSESESDGGSDDSDHCGDDGDDLAGCSLAESPRSRYDLSDDRSDLSTIHKPIYLRTCLEMLSVGEESDAIDKHEAVLGSLEALVRMQPADLSLLADPLTHAVLSLENRFNLQGFDAQRRGILVALGATQPRKVLAYLIEAFFHQGSSTGTKLEALDVLVATSAELAGRNPTNHKTTQEPKPSLLTEQLKSTASRALEPALDTESAGKTRRWGYRRSRPAVPTRNAFAEVSREIFFPLTRGLIVGGHFELYSHPDASQLVSQLLLALSALAECSQNCESSTALALELLACSWPLRLSSDAAVRRSALVALTVCLLNVPIDRLSGCDVESIADFVQQCRDTDPDAGCRGAAMKLSRAGYALCRLVGS